MCESRSILERLRKFLKCLRTERTDVHATLSVVADANGWSLTRPSKVVNCT